MRKLSGIAKLGAAALLVMALVFAIILNFDTDELDVMLFVTLFALVATVVYCSYLVPTGLWDLRGTRSPMPWWMLPGLILFMLSNAAAIYQATNDLRLYGSVIPFALIGLVISIRDVVEYKRSRSDGGTTAIRTEPSSIDPERKLTFTVQLERNEWIHFVFRKTYNTPAVIWASLLGIMFLVTPVIAFSTGQDLPLAALIFGLFFGAIMLFAMPIITWRQAARQFREEVWVRDPVRYDVSSTGLHCTATGAEIRLDRGNVVLEEFRGWFIIKTGRYTGLYIPPRVLNNEQRAEFRAILSGLGPD